MPRRELKRSLRCGRLDAIDGSGGELVFKFTASRETKAGTHEHYEIALTVCRCGVGQLLAQIKEMHARDRDRISTELQRIQREIDALKVTA